MLEGYVTQDRGKSPVPREPSRNKYRSIVEGLDELIEAQEKESFRQERENKVEFENLYATTPKYRKELLEFVRFLLPDNNQEIIDAAKSYILTSFANITNISIQKGKLVIQSNPTYTLKNLKKKFDSEVIPKMFRRGYGVKYVRPRSKKKYRVNLASKGPSRNLYDMGKMPRDSEGNHIKIPIKAFPDVLKKIIKAYSPEVDFNYVLK